MRRVSYFSLVPCAAPSAGSLTDESKIELADIWQFGTCYWILAFLMTISSFGYSQCGAPTYQTKNPAGSWTTATDWNGAQPPYVLSGGAYTIPSGDIVRINSSNFTLNSNLIVNGTLVVTGRLVMPAGRTIKVNSGGSVTCCGSCGSPTAISIGGTDIWTGSGNPGDPPTLIGPITVSQSGLPISLLFFELGEKTLNSVTLKWATASEQNLDYFTLEKSEDNKYFFEIAKIQGHGTVTVRNDYAFENNSPFAGKSYYRLKETDFPQFFDRRRC